MTEAQAYAEVSLKDHVSMAIVVRIDTTIVEILTITPERESVTNTKREIVLTEAVVNTLMVKREEIAVVVTKEGVLLLIRIKVVGKRGSATNLEREIAHLEAIADTLMNNNRQVQGSIALPKRDTVRTSRLGIVHTAIRVNTCINMKTKMILMRGQIITDLKMKDHRIVHNNTILNLLPTIVNK